MLTRTDPRVGGENLPRQTFIFDLWSQIRRRPRESHEEFRRRLDDVWWSTLNGGTLYPKRTTAFIRKVVANRVAQALWEARQPITPPPRERVLVDGLADRLKDFYERERKAGAGSNGRLSPDELLAEWTGIPVGRVRRIRRQRCGTALLDEADALLAAIGQADELEQLTPAPARKPKAWNDQDPEVQRILCEWRDRLRHGFEFEGERFSDRERHWLSTYPNPKAGPTPESLKQKVRTRQRAERRQRLREVEKSISRASLGRIERAIESGLTLQAAVEKEITPARLKKWRHRAREALSRAAFSPLSPSAPQESNGTRTEVERQTGKPLKRRTEVSPIRHTLPPVDTQPRTAVER